MIFYNGFNLLVDIVLIVVTAFWFHGVGYRRAKAGTQERMERRLFSMQKEYAPPF